jgi:hypothetical protein
LYDWDREVDTMIELLQMDAVDFLKLFNNTDPRVTKARTLEIVAN